MEKAHRETIEALAVAINAKDEVTHEHVLRVQIYAAGVARILGCNQAEIEALRAGALLHDIGKIAVPDYILNKPGKLTAAEFEKMKTHTIVGGQILARVEFPYPVVPVVRHHHERWDGRGYPDGLAETTEEPSSKEFSLKELRLLYELSQSVTSGRGRNTLLPAFTERLRNLVPYDFCAVTLVTHGENENVVAHATGAHSDLLMGRRIAIGEGVTGWVLANRQPFCNADPKLDIPPQLADHFRDFRTLAVYPLLAGTEIHGAITLYSSTLTEYDADQRRLLEEAARLLATTFSTSGEPMTANDASVEAVNGAQANEVSVAPGLM